MKRSGLLILIFFVLFSSCKKYEDGPAMSLHTKSHRLVGTWGIHAETEDGTDNTSNYQTEYYGYTLAITQDGSYAITYAYNGIFNYGETGTWDWNSDKTDVIFTKTSSNTTTDWKILELKEKELKVRFTDYSSNPNKTIEVTFTSLN